MAKFVSMRVEVVADDQVPGGMVHQALRDALGSMNIQMLEWSKPADGESLDADMPLTGRIHWPTANVVQAVERAPRQPGAPRKKAAASARS